MGVRNHLVNSIRSFVLGLAAILILAACNAEEFNRQANQIVDPLTGNTFSNSAQSNNNTQPRPVPTPFPTAELPPTPTPTPEADSEQVIELGIEDLAHAYTGALNADALRVTIEKEILNNGDQESITFEFIKPDQFHLRTDEEEIIVSGGLTYQRQFDENWFISPVSSMELFGGIFDPYLEEGIAEDQLAELLAKTIDVSYAGQKMFGDTECYIATYTRIQAANLPPQEITVWLGEQDGLLYREIIDLDENDQISRTTITYAYGDNVEIRKPFP